MKRTAIFVLIVTVVAGAFSFVMTGLTARMPAPPDPTFAAVALGMAAGALFLLLSGNRRVRVADAATRAATLAESPAVGMARLLIVRQSKIGVMVGVDVEVDGAIVTQLKSPRFAVVRCRSGGTRWSPGRRAGAPSRSRSSLRRARRRSSASLPVSAA